jgi:hypothetical protein
VHATAGAGPPAAAPRFQGHSGQASRLQEVGARGYANTSLRGEKTNLMIQSAVSIREERRAVSRPGQWLPSAPPAGA